MVRRTEFTLGKAIRAGQERGTVATVGARTMPETYLRNGKPVRGGVVRDENLTSPREFFSGGSQEMVGTYALSDNVTPEGFEEALSEARALGHSPA